MADTDLTSREPSRIADLCDQAYSAGRYAKAAQIARQGAELATARGDHDWRVHFRFWEGASLREAGDRTAATTALMEAARTEPEADPADVYNAITTLIEIAIDDKPAAFTRRLIAQGRVHLEHSGKTAWRHKLDWLEGHLAGARGDWEAALGHHRDGHEAKHRHRDYPGYTTATHLFGLAEGAFRRHDGAALDHWRRALDDCRKEAEIDHLYAEQARLLCHRAGLPGLGAPVTTARGLLRRLAGFEGDRAGFAREALRVLVLNRHWELVDEWLPRPGIGDDWLLAGDCHQARAREDLGLPPRDEDWSTDPERTDPAERRSTDRLDRARDHLTAARAHYQSKLDWAAQQDRRLATDWYTATLQTRIGRTADLGSSAL